MNIKVEIRNLSYSISDYRILEDVSRNVSDKKMVGVIGPNGSGKTTLLKHIYRALPPQKKTVYINQKEIESYNFSESAREITVMRQENTSDFDFTVMDMVLLGRAPYRKYFEAFSAEDRKIAKKALVSIGMDKYADRSFNALSGGEKQRVLIARSLTQGADILILDEPTNHLDVHYQWNLMELISKMNRTVLSVFHELNLASKFCDYIYVLQNGQIVSEGKPKDVFTKDLMADVFRVDAEIISTEEGHPHIIYN
ncbi:MAG: ABC transporter ATP-binding protein, partial [Oscillospiraceae bacterium]|nr:ABC transporter ATP-binding protein [Oscillospiraceae bacterium]